MHSILFSLSLEYFINVGVPWVSVSQAALRDAHWLASQQGQNPSCPFTQHGDALKRKFAVVSFDQKRCFELVRDAEERRGGKRYTHVMKLRTDQQVAAAAAVVGRFCFRVVDVDTLLYHQETAWILVIATLPSIRSLIQVRSSVRIPHKYATITATLVTSSPCTTRCAPL